MNSYIPPICKRDELDLEIFLEQIRRETLNKHTAVEKTFTAIYDEHDDKVRKLLKNFIHGKQSV